MSPRTVAAVALMLAGTSAARADGCKYRLDGRLVPEREQRGLLSWADGTQTLYVAATSDPTATGSVWVVPARADAISVRAEPVEEFPVVASYHTLKARAVDRL